MTDNNQTMGGIDLRSDASWEGIEQALKLIYVTLSRTVTAPVTTMKVTQAEELGSNGQWK